METGTVNLYNTGLTTTNYGEILQGIIRNNGFALNIIENYNNEMDRILQVIGNEKIKTRDGVVSFTNVKFRKPTIEINGLIQSLTPMIARERINRYFAEIVADLNYKVNPVIIDGIAVYPTDKPTEDLKQGVTIAYIPVMLGSKLCYLDTMTTAERMVEGECFTDIFGYFIIHSERIIISQEILRLSTFLIWESDGIIIGNLTCPTQQGTILSKLIVNKNHAIMVYLSHLAKQKNPPFPPLFAIYKLFDMEMDEAIENILSFIDEKYYDDVLFQLEATKAEYNTLMAGNDDKETLIDKLLERRRYSDSRVTSEKNVEDIEYDLFPHIPNREQKLLHLSMYTAKVLECMIGIRKMDDRDSYGNKKIETAGSKLAQLFKAIWVEHMNSVSLKAQDVRSLLDVKNLISSIKFKDDITSAFGSNSWGTKSMRKKENITEFLKRDTPIAVISQMQKVNVPVSRRAAIPKLRMPHGSGIGYIDPFDTPEGEGTGLVRNLSCTCYISLEKDPYNFYEFCATNDKIKKYVFEQRYAGTVPLLVNGIVKYWCIPEKTTILIKKFKNENLYYKDACVFYNKRDRCVEFTCNGGRPTRPLFVVNKNCTLNIDTNNLWNADMDELLKTQSIEYIDAREQEWIYLAESVDYVYHRKELLDELSKSKDESKINIIKQQLQETIPYEYCEIDPTAMFSISSNIIPHANRQAGPRTAYQCVEENTLIMMSDGTEKPIKDIKNGDEVITINPASLKSELSKIHSHFIIDSKIKGNCVYKITADEKEIIATADHLFLTETGWKEAGVLVINERVALSNSKKTMFYSITKIVKVNHCMVADFTTESSNHSFIANGFVTHNCGMNRQALTQYHSNEYRRFDTSYKMMNYPKKALFQTDTQDTAGINLMPNGITAHVAIMAHPDNPEDSIIIKEESIEYANMFDMCKKITSISKINIIGDVFLVKLGKPPIKTGEKVDCYHAINENGIPRLDAYINHGDCILGKVKEYRKSTPTIVAGTKENVSIFASIGEEGYIDRVLITHNVKTKENIVKVKIRQNRKYQPGDKMAMRYSQKGTVAKIIPARELPMVASGPLKGMVPDLIINPHSQPSRMTINNIIEFLVSKAASVKGEFVNATTFRDFSQELEYAQQVLEDYGLDPSGKEEFVLPSGRKMKVKCYFGPVHYQALRHHVVDKIQMRSRRGVQMSTRQPVSGRPNEGGLKVGEMERDALISHGASALLRERLCDVSDAYNLPVCKCGVIAITNHEEGIYKCTACGTNAKIGVIRIPYVVKLLLHWLNGAGIHMKFKVSQVATMGGRPEEKFLL
jgi:DNA-directed RNA polymerase beta subunit